ncbi:hypothetical protein SH668x_000172 [Planctomicrobium sp. SH668]|uniref:hypothetical protein n=1 Tax=Planctomicrobium sp. SH668 TaxID=3448126 RepID=UPI003F5B151E
MSWKLLGAVSLFFMVNLATADVRFPMNPKPLSHTVSSVSKQGYEVYSVSIAEHQWVMQCVHQGKSYRLKVDPVSSAIVDTEEIEELKEIKAKLKMAEVLKQLETTNPGPIIGVRFSDKSWIVSTSRGKKVTEIGISAQTGFLTSGKDD